MELCLLIRAKQNTQDSGGTLPPDSSFATLICWNERSYPFVYVFRWMVLSGWKVKRSSLQVESQEILQSTKYFSETPCNLVLLINIFDEHGLF